MAEGRKGLAEHLLHVRRSVGVTLPGFSHAGGEWEWECAAALWRDNEPREEEVGECAGCWVAKVVFGGKPPVHVRGSWQPSVIISVLHSPGTAGASGPCADGSAPRRRSRPTAQDTWPETKN